jgi:cytidine deaminase
MRQRQFQTNFISYYSIEELPKEYQALLNLAKESLEHSYSPYSNFKVGAAALMKNGKMYGGSNQENAAYPLCLCAERVTLSAAESQSPNVPIEAMAITVKNPNQIINSPAMPCGSCRQVLCETERKHKNEIEIIIQGEVGEIFVFKTAKDLLPFSFNESFL